MSPTPIELESAKMHTEPSRLERRPVGYLTNAEGKIVSKSNSPEPEPSAGSAR